MGDDEPNVGVTLVIVAAGLTVKGLPLLAIPPTLTTTFPVVAPAGTVTRMKVLLHEVTGAGTPLNVTVLVPCVSPNPAPVTETASVGAPLVGESLVMPGPGLTVNSTPLLATPPSVTTTLPVTAVEGTVATMDVALQLVTDANRPLKVTVLPF